MSSQFFAVRGFRLGFALMAALAVGLLREPAAVAANSCPTTIVMPTGVGVGTASDVTTLNLLLSSSLYSTEAAELLYPVPLYVDPNAQIDWSRSLYAKIEPNRDGTTYLVTLHRRLWSDGVPLTADDFLYTYQLMIALGSNYTNYGVGGIPNLIKKFTVLDPEHFEIDLTQKSNPTWFTLGGLASFWPFPRHIWGKYSADEVYEHQSDPDFFRAVYGPYKLETLQLGLYASFVPNPLYPLHKPTQRLVLKFVESDGEALQGVQSDEIDLANLPFSVFEIGRNIKDTYLVHPTPPLIDNNIGVNFNDTSSPYFHDVRVRQAMEDAIDQKAIIKAALHGQGLENYNLVPPRPAVFNSPDARAGKFPVGYDPAKADALLDAAGYKIGPDGIRVNRDGVKIAITMLVASNQEYRIAMAEMVQREFLAVGIKLTIKLVDFNQLLATIFSNVEPWQAYLIGDTFGGYPSGELLYKTGGVENFGHYSDAKMDRLIQANITEPGEQGLYDYEDYGAEQQPVIFLPLEVDTVLTHNDITGVEQLNTPDTGWYPQYLNVRCPHAGQ